MIRRRDPGYLAAADVLRIVCIGLVVWYHIWQQSWLDPGFHIGKNYVNLQQMVRNGYLMVDVLLALSGFLLALPHARRQTDPSARFSLKEYYVNRFWRIYPAYVLAVVLCFIWAAAVGRYNSSAFMWKDLFAHLTFTHNLFTDTYYLTPLPAVLWTLAVEVQFYLVFPLIALFYRERPKLTCLILALFGLAFRLWVYPQSGTAMLVNQLPAMLDLYACGMFAAHLYARLSERALSVRARWAFLVLAAAALLMMLQIMYWQTLGGGDDGRRGQLVWRLPLGLLSCAFLVGGCLAPPAAAKLFGNPLTRFFAAVSYNVYIWHQFLALRLKELHIPPYTSELPNQAGEQPWQTRYTLLCFAAAIAVGALLTYLWERPVMRRAKECADT